MKYKHARRGEGCVIGSLGSNNRKGRLDMDGASSTQRRDSNADLEVVKAKFPALVTMAGSEKRLLDFLALIADIEYCVTGRQRRNRIEQLHAESRWQLPAQDLASLLGRTRVKPMAILRELWQFDNRSNQRLCFFGVFPLLSFCLRGKFSNRSSAQLVSEILLAAERGMIESRHLAQLVIAGRIRNPGFCPEFETTVSSAKKR